jgi:hypothetical protein
METAEALTWRKSSYSTSNGGNCVEVTSVFPKVTVRDSKAPSGHVLRFGDEDWLSFTRRVKDSRPADTSVIT